MLKNLVLIMFGVALGSCSISEPKPTMSKLEGKPISSLSVIEREPLTQAQRGRIYPLIRSRKGTIYSQDRIDQDIRDLYSSGYLEDIVFFAEPENGKVKVRAEIEARPVLESGTP